MKFCTEIDLEIIRIVKHIKKTAAFFKFRNTETNKELFTVISILPCTVMKNKYFLYSVPIMISVLFIPKCYK